MPLTPYHRERLEICNLLIQSARKSLSPIDGDTLPEILQINQCFDTAETAIDKVLRPQ